MLDSAGYARLPWRRRPVGASRSQAGAQSRSPSASATRKPAAPAEFGRRICLESLEGDA